MRCDMYLVAPVPRNPTTNSTLLGLLMATTWPFRTPSFVLKMSRKCRTILRSDEKEMSRCSALPVEGTISATDGESGTRESKVDMQVQQRIRFPKMIDRKQRTARREAVRQKCGPASHWSERRNATSR